MRMRSLPAYYSRSWNVPRGVKELDSCTCTPCRPGQVMKIARSLPTILQHYRRCALRTLCSRTAQDDNRVGARTKNYFLRPAALRSRGDTRIHPSSAPRDSLRTPASAARPSPGRRPKPARATALRPCTRNFPSLYSAAYLLRALTADFSEEP